ncbi:anthranilate synthase component I [Lactococcus nasutitermitis]|uniref:Anthranilate synthase component 1 n=1 Tax=Lactococcus nasutitermitis TaxID=1652957 RepID=A0ABV9JCU8_9LACT|nr:anthranilate synthase component I [Lactococcus nasutitermitis]
MRIKKEISADSLTPISVYLRLTGKNKIILESIPRENDQSRFSIIAVNPVHHIKFDKNVLTIDDKAVKTDNPLKTIENLVARPEDENDGLPFASGAIGYAGFDTYGIYENIQVELKDKIGTPDIYFMLYESYVIFDHKREKLILIEDNVYSQRDEQALENELSKKLTELSKMTASENAPRQLKKMTFTSNTTQENFENKVSQARELIHNGDMFQIVISQRLTADFTAEPFDYYRELRVENPSSYMYFLEFDNFHVIGSSPERLVAVQNGIVSTNPIAGTRKRGESEEEDNQLIEELENDEKETAEHKMLVDLGRNDIGKIAEYGSVEVPVFMKVEKYRYVMHITSEVKGKLRPEFTAMDALISTLPAGTLSGAPKNRAYKRIYEFEQDKRGIYGGAVGYLTKHGNSDFAIAIRTMILKDGKANVQAGAGIVYDSDPASEYQETLNKARGLLEIGE